MYSDLLPSTSVANTVLSGTIAPAPITPPPRPTITARAKRSVRMNDSPSPISENVDVHSNFWSSRFWRRGIGSPNTMTAETT